MVADAVTTLWPLLLVWPIQPLITRSEPVSRRTVKLSVGLSSAAKRSATNSVLGRTATTPASSVRNTASASEAARRRSPTYTGSPSRSLRAGAPGLVAVTSPRMRQTVPYFPLAAAGASAPGVAAAWLGDTPTNIRQRPRLPSRAPNLARLKVQFILCSFGFREIPYPSSIQA